MVGYVCLRDSVHSASLSNTRAIGVFFLRGIFVAFNFVRQKLKLLQTRRQRESMAGDKCIKTCCQSSGGHPAAISRLGLGLASGTDTLGFLATSCAVALTHASSRSVSLSLRFAPARVGHVFRSAEPIELEESETSISEEESPSPPAAGRGCCCAAFRGMFVPLVGVGCVLVNFEAISAA
jgi:hypothetical protein